MRFFLDTEFIERGPDYPIQLVSIGIVSESERIFYAVSSDFDPETASAWVKQNVLPYLGDGPRISRAQIAKEASEFVQSCDLKYAKPEFWGYYADYDWVVFCQLFGAMIDLPKGWPMYCRDIKQLCDECGNPKLPEHKSTEHNALADALWNREAYEFLTAAQVEKAKTGI